MVDSIRKALSAWPAERFPDGYQDFWAEKFAAYPPDEVAKAIDVLRMSEDPHTPTTSAVERILARWEVKQNLPAPAPAVEYAKVRARGAEIESEQAEADAVYMALDAGTFERLAREALSAITPEARILCRNPRRSRLVRGVVAQLARRQRVACIRWAA